MSNKLRVIVIVVIIVLIIAVFLAFIRPAMQKNINISNEIEQQSEKNNKLLSQISQFSESKDKFNILYARYQKYSVELPSSSKIQVLANEIYNIAQFAEIDLQSINFNETINSEDGLGIISINMVLSGPYYNILVFVKSFESMPRITKVEKLSLSHSGDGYPEMIAVLEGITFYQIME